MRALKNLKSSREEDRSRFCLRLSLASRSFGWELRPASSQVKEQAPWWAMWRSGQTRNKSSNSFATKAPRFELQAPASPTATTQLIHTMGARGWASPRTPGPQTRPFRFGEPCQLLWNRLFAISLGRPALAGGNTQPCVPWDVQVLII